METYVVRVSHLCSKADNNSDKNYNVFRRTFGGGEWRVFGVEYTNDKDVTPYYPYDALPLIEEHIPHFYITMLVMQSNNIVLENAVLKSYIGTKVFTKLLDKSIINIRVGEWY